MKCFTLQPLLSISQYGDLLGDKKPESESPEMPIKSRAKSNSLMIYSLCTVGAMHAWYHRLCPSCHCTKHKGAVSSKRQRLALPFVMNKRYRCDSAIHQGSWVNLTGVFHTKERIKFNASTVAVVFWGVSGLCGSSGSGQMSKRSHAGEFGQDGGNLPTDLPLLKSTDWRCILPASSFVLFTSIGG